MGNHDVGRAMAGAAKGFWAGNGDAPVSKKKALAVLDAAAEDFRGSDAEFDDAMRDANTPLGRLIAIAFGWTDEDEASEKVHDLWYEKVCEPFSDRYNFC